MHHTYEVIEARGWIQREFSPQCKVLADIVHCAVHTTRAQQDFTHSHTDWMLLFVADENNYLKFNLGI